MASHLPTLTFTHQWQGRCHAYWEQHRGQRPAQGDFDTWTGGAGDLTGNPGINAQCALPAQPIQ